MKRGLSPEAEALNERPVPAYVLFMDVSEQSAPPPNHLEEAAPRMVVLTMLAQVICDVVDSLRQNRDLHFRRARVAIVALVLLQDFFFLSLFQLLPHLASSLQTFRSRRLYHLCHPQNHTAHNRAAARGLTGLVPPR